MPHIEPQITPSRVWGLLNQTLYSTPLPFLAESNDLRQYHLHCCVRVQRESAPRGLNGCASLSFFLCRLVVTTINNGHIFIPSLWFAESNTVIHTCAHKCSGGCAHRGSRTSPHSRTSNSQQSHFPSQDAVILGPCSGGFW
jgi:hypothetical protein